ncbi:hypothetical protein [Caldinitratiruptor microaerophilus]|uniref:Uncharacterized protein n=1 Tax=Caldinitratiruptor microaerophilus TaxID=671077 RepID=A0AA35CIG9_9FIRM|nr:hypothetical protein [Caldinitratiruptor microaerophilus]BDG59759.1 hypothetical protein caldi_08490 [Caldinitratiruptor microaerophilus]
MIAPIITDQRGSLGILAAALLLLFAAVLAGFAIVHEVAAARSRIEQALVAALDAAAAQTDPLLMAATGRAEIVEPRARAAFLHAFPQFAGLSAGWAPPPADPVMAGPVVLEDFRVYRAADAGTRDPLGQPVSGPSVYAQVRFPVTVRFLGLPASRMDVRVATRQAAPSYDQPSGSWQYR